MPQKQIIQIVSMIRHGLIILKVFCYRDAYDYPSAPNALMDH